MIPLYIDNGINCGVGEQRETRFLSGNNGLWFERFFNQYDASWTVNQQGKKHFLQTLMDPNGRDHRCGNTDLIKRYIEQKVRLVTSLDGNIFAMRSTWHFATGLGNPHPVENALLWHPTLGTPYLPASAVKGLARAWLELHDYDKTLVRRLFGSDNKDPAKATGPASKPELVSGEIIFFDALPLAPVTLRIDTMTPHLGKWYEQGSDRPGTADTTPADWHAPVPVQFLVADDVNLAFSLAPRTPAAKELLPLAREALSQALQHLGAGSKTAAGYGQFSNKSQEAARELKRILADVAEEAEERQKEREIQALTDEQRTIRELEEKMSQPMNQTAGSGFPSELQRALENAREWPDKERQHLALMSREFYKKYNCWGKKHEKARKALIRELLGES